MPKASRDSLHAKGKTDVYYFDPVDVVLVENKESVLYDERVDNDFKESLVLNMMFAPDGVPQGVLKVLLGRRHPETGKVEIIDGRQRTKAAREANRRLKKAGIEPIRLPVLLKRVSSDQRMMAMLISSNEHGTEDSPSAKARKAQRYIDLGRDEKEVAVLLGVSEATVKNMLRLLDAPAAVRNAADAGKITQSDAYKLSREEPEEARKKLGKLLEQARAPPARSGARTRARLGRSSAAAARKRQPPAAPGRRRRSRTRWRHPSPTGSSATGTTWTGTGSPRRSPLGSGRGSGARRQRKTPHNDPSPAAVLVGDAQLLQRARGRRRHAWGDPMTKARSALEDNGGLCEGCSAPSTLHHPQQAHPIWLGGDLGWGTMWLCSDCLKQRRERDARLARAKIVAVIRAELRQLVPGAALDSFESAQVEIRVHTLRIHDLMAQWEALPRCSDAMPEALEGVP